jgi:hypothetical protein
MMAIGAAFPPLARLSVPIAAGYSCISIQIPPNRHLPLEVPEGPAAATSIQKNSGCPKDRLTLPPAG